MKHAEKNQAPLTETPFLVGSQEVLSELELTMTQSSMGYEYTLKEIDDQDVLGLEKDRLQLQLEEFQSMYLEAREKFVSIDSVRLEEFETDLKRQKAVLFQSNKEVLH